MSMESTATARPDLATVASDVLGDLAFMVADDERVHYPDNAVWLEGRVQYHGPHSGELTCWSTRALANQLSQNLLGLMAADVSPDAGVDAVREFMNVLCGQLVTRWYGAGPVFDLSIPVVTPIEAPPLGDDRGRTAMMVDGQPLLIAHKPLA